MRTLRRRVLPLALTALVLYGVAPAIVEVLGGWRDLRRIEPPWIVALVLTQVAGLWCFFAVQRLALRTDDWFAVATSNMAGGAVGRSVPGGSATAAAIQYGMLLRAGIPAGSIAGGLAAGSLLLLAVLAALPLLALPAVLAGISVPDALLNTGLLALGLFAALFAFGAVVMTSDRAIGASVRVVHLGARLLRRDPPRRLRRKLIEQRDTIRVTLGRRWLQAVGLSAGRWLFDWLTLLAALAALGVRPGIASVLLAYCVSQLLAQVPLTPGGLGIVEAGMTGTLALAGVAGGAAAVATLAYRLVSYWLQIPAGGIAWVLFRRRYGAPDLDD